LTTWRVPEDLKAEISALVPSRYRTVAEAMSTLCRQGLSSLSDETGELEKRVNALEEKFKGICSEKYAVPMIREREEWTRPGQTSTTTRFRLNPALIPQMSILFCGIRFMAEPSDKDLVEHSTFEAEHTGLQLIRPKTPLSWATSDFYAFEKDGYWHPNAIRGELMFYVDVTPNPGYLAPKGTFYVQYRRARI